MKNLRAITVSVALAFVAAASFATTSFASQSAGSDLSETTNGPTKPVFGYCWIQVC